MYKLNSKKYGTHKIVANYLGVNNTILDIGCNKGYLKRMSPRNMFYGIDIDGTCLNVAHNVNGYEKVIKEDMNFRLPEIKRKFDVVVFADILEHLINPEKVLSYYVKNNLNKDGLVIISVPNVAHVTIRVGLLFGKFEYTKEGILDSTHLHLYTVSSIKKLINLVGLRVKKIEFSSDRLGFLLKRFNFLGSLMGYNIILICQKKF